MQIEKIEQAIELITFNAQTLQNELSTDFFDALIEQNVLYQAYRTGQSISIQNAAICENFQTLQSLGLEAEEYRKVFQLVVVKAYQTTPIQANHTLTPDSIGFIFAYLISNLTQDDQLKMVDFGSGTGNLSQTIEFGVSPEKIASFTGIEVDDLLIDLSASMADICESKLNLVAMDAVQFQTGEVDVVISDLPVGYYPNNTVAANFQVAADEGHTYAHHLLIENALRNLKAGGFGIFLAPLTLFDSEQSDLLAKWLKKSSYLQMVINLPESLFKGKQQQKSIYIFEKPSDSNSQKEVFVYQLSDLKNPTVLQNFMKQFKQWQIA